MDSIRAGDRRRRRRGPEKSLAGPAAQKAGRREAFRPENGESWGGFVTFGANNLQKSQKFRLFAANLAYYGIKSGKG